MSILREVLLWLTLAFVCFLPAAALTPDAPENRIWEIFSIGYDAPVAEATDLGSRPETSTSNYDTASIRSAATEKIPTEANRSLFGQNAEFKAAEEVPVFPKTAEEMEDFLKVPGKKIPDGPTTPGRNKVVFQPNPDTKIPASALTPSAPENRVWEIFSIGYDAPTAELTDLSSRTETSTSDYDTAPIDSAAIEEKRTEANRTVFGKIAEGRKGNT